MTDDEGTQLRDRLRLLTADIAFLREQVDAILTMLAETALGTAVDTATDTANGSAGTAAAGTQAGGWDGMTAEQATGAWQRLSSWVDWLTCIYELHEDIPGCWYQHRALLDELNALCLAWHGANAPRGTGPSDRLYWHEQLDRALPRLRAWNIRGCASDTHRPATGPPTATTDRHDREQHIRADIAARN